MSKRIMTLACLLALAASAVLADDYQVVVDLTACNTAVCNMNLNPIDGIYGTVTKTLVDSTAVDIDGNPVPISSGSGNIWVQLALFNGLVLVNNGLAFNSSATLGTGDVTGITDDTGITPSTHYPSLNTGGTSMDGFTTGQDQANFQYYIPADQNGMHPWASTTLSFIVNGPFSSVEVIDVANAAHGGYEWAAEVGVQGRATGFIANGASVVTPEPGTIALFGMGLLGAGVAIRRRRK